MMISNGVKLINEGDRFVPAGSITTTIVTHFDPPGESDITRYIITMVIIS